MSSLNARKARAARRRKRRMGRVEHDLSDDQWLALIEAWGGCAYCGDAEKPLQRDCVLPISRGGRYTLENVVPACQPCNSSKCNEEVTTWMRSRRRDERTFLIRHLEISSALKSRFPSELDELFSTFELSETIRIAAPARHVWDLIVDIDRMTEFSPELVRVDWLGGASAPAVGARFAGTSRVGTFEWTRNCTITAFEEATLFAFDVADEADAAPQSRWRFELTPDGDATTVSQHFAHVPTGRSTIRLMAERDIAEAEATVAERAKKLIAGMRRTLEAMRVALEG